MDYTARVNAACKAADKRKQFQFVCTHKTDGATHKLACTASTEALARAAIESCWDVSVGELIATRRAHDLLAEVVAD